MRAGGVVRRFDTRLGGMGGRHVVFSNDFKDNGAAFLGRFFRGSRVRNGCFLYGLFPIGCIASGGGSVCRLVGFSMLLRLLNSKVSVRHASFSGYVAVKGSLGGRSLGLVRDVIRSFSLMGRSTGVVRGTLSIVTSVCRSCGRRGPRGGVGEFLARLRGGANDDCRLGSVSLLVHRVLVGTDGLKNAGGRAILLVSSFSELRPVRSFELLGVLSIGSGRAGVGRGGFKFSGVVVIYSVGGLESYFVRVGNATGTFGKCVSGFCSARVFRFGVGRSLIETVDE